MFIYKRVLFFCLIYLFSSISFSEMYYTTVLDINKNIKISSSIEDLVQDNTLKPEIVSCALRHCYSIIDGQVYSIGSNSNGILGVGDSLERLEWTPTGLMGATAISASTAHGYAIANGQVYSIGSNYGGRLGINEADTSLSKSEWTPTGLMGATKILAAGNRGYAIVNGSLFVVGLNMGKSLIIDSSENISWENTNISGVTDFAAGHDYAYFIINDSLFSIGENSRGQLGLSNNTDTYNLTPVPNISGNVTDLAAYPTSSNEYGHIIVDGQIYSVGSNVRGSLGQNNSNTFDYSTTFLPTGIFGATKIEGGGYLSLAIVNGEVYFVGYGTFFGLDSDNYIWKPLGLTNVIDLDVGVYHACALTSTNLDWYCIGYNAGGQMGTGDKTTKTSWVKMGFEQ